MTTNEKITAYFKKEHPFKEGIALLRKIAQETSSEETFKWSLPVYTINGKNVFAIGRFKDFFGVWFFNGASLKDSKIVLRNAQEGKTKAMRHWNFTSISAIDRKGVLAYMNEAIKNQETGRTKPMARKKSTAIFQIPLMLEHVLKEDAALSERFHSLAPYKQKEYCEFLGEAKREETKQRRLHKILPLIKVGLGLNDKYR